LKELVLKCQNSHILYLKHISLHSKKNQKCTVVSVHKLMIMPQRHTGNADTDPNSVNVSIRWECKIHTFANLPPGIKPQENEWVRELVWTMWRREISAASTKNQNTISLSPSP